MNHAEKAFVIFYFTYLLAYIPCFFLLMPRYFFQLLPFHFFGMFIGLVLFIVVFRDLYKRDFPTANSKLTWAILMLVFTPTILVYLYKHGFRPRGDPVAPDDRASVAGEYSETGNPYQSPQSPGP